MLEDVPRRTKILACLAALLLAGAGANLVFRVFASDDPSLAELKAAAEGQTYRVRCNACAGTFEMPAVEYLVQFHDRADGSDDGIECRHCGVNQAFRTDVVDDAHPPEELAARADSVSLREVQTHMQNVQGRLSAVDAELLRPETAADPQLEGELQRQKQDLQAQMNWLDRKWEELASRP